MAQSFLDEEGSPTITMTTNIMASPRHVGNAVSGLSLRDSKQSAYGARHMQDLYAINTREDVDGSPTFALRAEEIGPMTSGSGVTVQSDPACTFMYIQPQGIVSTSRDYWPAESPQMAEKSPQGLIWEGDRVPRNFWVRLPRVHDQGGSLSTGYWPFSESSRPRGTSEPITVACPEVPGPKRNGRGQFGVKRLRASEGHYGTDEQGGQARRIDSPHRLIRRVPTKISHHIPNFPPMSFPCPCIPTQANTGLVKSRKKSFTVAEMSSSHTLRCLGRGAHGGAENSSLNSYRADVHGHSDTAKSNRDISRSQIAENSNAAIGACSSLKVGGNFIAGVAGQEEFPHVWAELPMGAACGPLCPCWNLNGEGSLKVQRLSLGRVESSANDVDRLGAVLPKVSGVVDIAVPGRIARLSGAEKNVREKCGAFFVNNDVPLGFVPRVTSAFEASPDGATGSGTGLIRPSRELRVPWSQERNGRAEAQAWRHGSPSAGTSSSYGCFTPWPGAEIPTDIVSVTSSPPEPRTQDELLSHMDHARVTQCDLDRSSGSNCIVRAHDGEVNAKMDVEKTTEGKSRNARPFPGGTCTTEPFWRALPLPLPPLQGAKGALGDKTAMTTTSQCKTNIMNKEILAIDAVVATAAGAMEAVTAASEAAGKGEGQSLEEEILAGGGSEVVDDDTDDDSSDAAAAHEEISAWLHGTEDWWTS